MKANTISKSAYDKGYKARTMHLHRNNPYTYTILDAYAKYWDNGYDTADRHIREKD